MFNPPNNPLPAQAAHTPKKIWVKLKPCDFFMY